MFSLFLTMFSYSCLHCLVYPSAEIITEKTDAYSEYKLDTDASKLETDLTDAYETQTDAYIEEETTGDGEILPGKKTEERVNNILEQVNNVERKLDDEERNKLEGKDENKDEDEQRDENEDNIKDEDTVRWNEREYKSSGPNPGELNPHTTFVNLHRYLPFTLYTPTPFCSNLHPTMPPTFSNFPLLPHLPSPSLYML